LSDKSAKVVLVERAHHLSTSWSGREEAEGHRSVETMDMLLIRSPPTVNKASLSSGFAPYSRGTVPRTAAFASSSDSKMCGATPRFVSVSPSLACMKALVVKRVTPW